MMNGMQLKKDSTSRVFRWGKERIGFCIWTNIILFVVFAILLLPIATKDHGGLVVTIIFLLMLMAVGTIRMLNLRNQRVRFDGKNVYYTNVFKKERVYSYETLQTLYCGACRYRDYYTLYFKDGIVKIDGGMDGVDDINTFLPREFAEVKYKRIEA